MFMCSVHYINHIHKHINLISSCYKFKETVYVCRFSFNPYRMVDTKCYHQHLYILRLTFLPVNILWSFWSQKQQFLKLQELLIFFIPANWLSVIGNNLSICFLIRVEGNQFEDREANNMWLVRHLEVTRQLMIDDLKVVKVKLVINVDENVIRLL